MMIGEILRFSIQQRWMMFAMTLIMAGLGAYNVTASHRRRAGHHQRASADQRPGRRIVSAGNGATDHLPSRNRDGGASTTGKDPVPLTVCITLIT